MDRIREPDEHNLTVKMLLGSFRKIIEKANELDSLLRYYMTPKNSVNNIFESRIVHTIEGKLVSIITSYNEELAELKKLPEDVFKILLDRKPIDWSKIDTDFIEFYATKYIQEIIINSAAIVSILENLQNEKYGKHFEETSKLEGEIQKIEFSNKLIYNHLMDSIRSLNNDTYIGAVLTAGKVASFILENIKLDDEGRKTIDSFKKSNSNNTNNMESKDNERVRILVEKGLIREDEKDNFIRGIRRLRNAYTHNLEYMPEGYNEAISFVTSAISLAMIYSKLQNDKTPNNTNTG